MRPTNGFLNNFDGYYPERIVISALMIADGFLAALAALICIMLLRKLVILSVPAYPIQLADRSRSAQDYNRTLASVALIKLVFGVGALGLSVFIEYEHEKVGDTDKYIKIAQEHIAAMLAIMSSNSAAENLRFYAALALAIVAAVWCIKTVDHNTMPFYKNDLKLFYQERPLGDPSATAISGARRIIVIAHGVLIGVFGILFFLCALSSVIVGTYLRVESMLTSFRIDKGTAIQGRCKRMKDNKLAGPHAYRDVRPDDSSDELFPFYAKRASEI
ncbi:hypothetical protein ANCCAN_14538 [Ancylostoma caninum]|uniref:Uncharacterized protein n=1 Tax=Ancylostoma caninum TaxID=29170 RepID=A0A368G9W1_ANCCA|nr:hypothetical protein ANCCAN_14538 [Ancylostoma caninum]